MDTIAPNMRMTPQGILVLIVSQESTRRTQGSWSVDFGIMHITTTDRLKRGPSKYLEAKQMRRKLLPFFYFLHPTAWLKKVRTLWWDFALWKLRTRRETGPASSRWFFPPAWARKRLQIEEVITRFHDVSGIYVGVTFTTAFCTTCCYNPRTRAGYILHRRKCERVSGNTTATKMTAVVVPIYTIVSTQFVNVPLYKPWDLL